MAETEAVSGTLAEVSQLPLAQCEALDVLSAEYAALVSEEVAIESIPLIELELEIAIEKAVLEELAPRHITNLLLKLGV